MNRTIPSENIENFRKDLTALINKYGLENACDTPDYILADMLISFYDAYSLQITRRDKWFGFDPFGDSVTGEAPENAGEVNVETRADPQEDAPDEPNIVPDDEEDVKSEAGFVVYRRIRAGVFEFFSEWHNKQPVLTNALDLAMHFTYKGMAEHTASMLGDGWRFINLDECYDEKECKKCEQLLKAIFGEDEDLNRDIAPDRKYHGTSDYHIIVPKGTRLKIVKVGRKPVNKPPKGE